MVFITTISLSFHGLLTSKMPVKIPLGFKATYHLNKAKALNLQDADCKRSYLTVKLHKS